MGSPHATLRIPAAQRSCVEQILALTDGLCTENLDAEYAELCARMVVRLGRKRPSPLARGDVRIWAATVVHAVGSVNFLFDRSQTPHLTADRLSSLTGVPKSTMANKARLIRELLRSRLYDPEFCRREMLERDPYAWLVQVEGFIVDGRALPEHLQAQERQRGLLPNVSRG